METETGKARPHEPDGTSVTTGLPDDRYEAPTLRVLGTVEEITEAKNDAGTDGITASTGSG